MTRTHRPPRRRGGRALSLAAFLATAGVALSAAQRSQPGPASGWAAEEPGLTADLVISHQRTGADGQSTGLDPAPVLMRLVRQQVEGRWHTTLALRETPRVTTLSPGGPRTFDNPFAIARVEVGDNGTATYFDAAGRVVNPPGPEDLHRVTVPGQPAAPVSSAATHLLQEVSPKPIAGGGAAGILVSRQEALAKRELLIRQLGPATTRLRGLDRFVSVEGDRTRELLLDPYSALPVEVITTRAGTLESHMTAKYERFDRNRYLRRSVRADRVLPDASGDHVVTTIVVTDVSVGDGGKS